MEIKQCTLYTILALIGPSLFALLLPSFLISQEKPATLQSAFYTINDGLSDRLVTDIFQDRQGFLWVGTLSGLNKFDGYDFIPFDDYPETKYQLSDKRIREIAPEQNGSLAIIYLNNTNFFDLVHPITHRIQRIETGLNNGITGEVKHIYINPKGEIFLIALEKKAIHLFQYLQRDNFKLIFTIPEESTSLQRNLNILHLQNGSFFINDSEKGLRLFRENGQLVKQFTARDFDCLQFPFRYPSSSFFLTQCTNGKVLVSLRGLEGVFEYNPIHQDFNVFHDLSGGNYGHLWEDRQGNILLTRVIGPGIFPEVEQVFCFSPDGQKHDFSYITNYSNRIINVSSKDFFKLIFLGTDTGLRVLQQSHQSIKTYLTSELKEGSRGKVIRGIVGDGQGMIYIGREVESWYALHLETDQIDTIRIIDPKTGQPVPLHCSMRLLYRDSCLWGISCQSDGNSKLIKYNVNTKQSTLYHYDYQINDLIFGQDNRIWFLYRNNKEGGMAIFDPTTNHFQHYKNKAGYNPLQKSNPRFLLQTQNGTFWVGTNVGLFEIDALERTSKHYQMEEKAPVKGLRSNDILVIHEDMNGKIWLGTSRGLNILDPKTGTFQSYDSRHGLANNAVCGILPDTANNMWISTYNGLSYFNQKDQLFRNYFRSDGLSHDEFNRFSFYRDFSGRYYFGGVNGLNTFSPRQLLNDDEKPGLQITGLSRYNAKINALIEERASNNQFKEIQIDPNDTYFQLSLSLLNFINPQKNQYFSRLDGFEKEWNYLGNNPTVRYTNVPPGNYRLLLKGADPNGNQSPQPLEVKITVAPHFYETWWFTMLSFFFIASMLFGFFQYQLNNRIKVERLRMKISSDLHDEVSGLLSGIAMQTDILQARAKDDFEKVKLQKIGEVSRIAMSKMSDVIWSFDSRKDRVEDLIHRMREHADEILLPLNIQYQFDVGKIDWQHKMQVGLRQDLYFIFKEALNNVAKHSGANMVKIFLGNEEDHFNLTIEDNGKGFNLFNRHKKTGQGLSNIKMRAKRLKGELTIQPTPGFLISLRIKKFA